jgi:hypothetical protein
LLADPLLASKINHGSPQPSKIKNVSRNWI